MTVLSNIARLLRVRDFALLWVGLTVSLFGDGIYIVAIAWEVYRLSSSPAALGAVGIAFAVPQVVFAVLGGVITDRLDRRVVLMAGSLVSGASIGLIGALSQLHVLQLWEIVVLVVVYGSSQAFYLPASTALLLTRAPADLLPQANAAQQFVLPIAMNLAGPALGGGIIALWGTGPAFVIDALTFVAAAVVVAFLSAQAPVADGAAEEHAGGLSLLRDAGRAAGYVRSQPWLWGSMVAAAVANLSLAGPVQVLFPYVIRFQLHSGPAALGLVFAWGGAGALVAALLVGWHGLPRRAVTLLVGVWAVAVLAIAPVALAGMPWQVMALNFLIQGGLAYGNTLFMTLLGVRVPGEMLGRVASFDFMVSFSLMPLSFALTGPLAALIGTRALLLIAGVAASVVIFAILLVPGVRERRSDTPASPERAQRAP
jgi:DHA3 family tetracycline resistance protein-like MFS transporter